MESVCLSKTYTQPSLSSPCLSLPY
uniref:Uncharacterized protein n=1 Tax=Anguilla anguilla TaxID=7936 RepID=A0A0E9T7K2_ANGAN